MDERLVKFRYVYMNLDTKQHFVSEGFSLKDIENGNLRQHDWFYSPMFFIKRRQQFTGLLDKNGKEIYEGDIVRYIYASTPPEVKVGAVEWSDDYLGWRFADLLIEPTPRKTIEVLGNIYENPELLK